MSQGFNGWPTWPEGWQFSGIGPNDYYTAPGHYGLASPSIRFNANNDQATSAFFASDSTNALTFWLRGINTTATSALKVEQFFSSTWNELATIQFLPIDGTMAGPFWLNPNANRVRFTQRLAGEVALDDVRVRRQALSASAYMRVYYLAWNAFGTTGTYGMAIYAELPGPDGILGTADDVRVLYDGGGTSSSYGASQGLSDFLDGRIGPGGTIHHMVLSHPHTDHFYGLHMAVNRYNIINFYENYPWDQPMYNSFKQALINKGVNLYTYNPGQYLSGPSTSPGFPKWDPNVVVRVLAALETGDQNADSGMLQVRLGDSVFLWGGDATKEAEDYARTYYSSDLARTDIYQAHHHGSGAGDTIGNHSTTDFLNAMKPLRYAIVPVAFRSTSEHPGAPALNRINTAGAIVYRNDLDYHVEVLCDNLGNYEIRRNNIWNTSQTTGGDLPNPPPPIVGSLSVRDETADYVVLRWDSTAPGDKYLVYRSPFSGGDPGAGRVLQIGINSLTGIYERITPEPISFTTFTDVSIYPGKSYFYRVAAVRSYTDGSYTTTQERRWSWNEAAHHPPEVWSLPAGGTRINGLDFDTYILIANPGDQNAPVDVRFVGPDGEIAFTSQTLGPRSRMTIKMNNHVGEEEAVSTIVTSGDVPIICERAMYWPGGSGQAGWIGGHNTVGIRQADKQWYLAEGATHIFDQFIHVLNPDEWQTADVEIVFSDQSGEIEKVSKQMPPRTNWTVDVKKTVGPSSAQVATYVSSNVAIAVDRTMYWDGGGVKWIDGHASAGVSSPATTWYLAEGATHIFDEYVMIYNPSTTATARVRLSFMDAAGNVVTREEDISPRARYTVKVNDVVGYQPQVATLVQSVTNTGNIRVPVVAERTMYWNAGGIKWGGGHGTAGAPREALVWHLPEGATHTFDQYILIYNAFFTQAANVTVEFMDGASNVWEHRVVVGPRSRFTVNVNDVVGPVNQISTVVRSDIPVVAERAMYWPRGGSSVWVGGHNTVGVIE